MPWSLWILRNAPVDSISRTRTLTMIRTRRAGRATSETSSCRGGDEEKTSGTSTAAGTENNDHNPPRIASRNLFDMAAVSGDKYKWSARLTVVNLTNKEALYNFLSTFSGTHYVSPGVDRDDRVPFLTEA